MRIKTSKNKERLTTDEIKKVAADLKELSTPDLFGLASVAATTLATRTDEPSLDTVTNVIAILAKLEAVYKATKEGKEEHV